MRLFSTFCGGNALNGNVKHFVFDLTCDVTDDPGSNFQLHLKDLVQDSPLSFIFPPLLLVTELAGGRYAPPPAEGRGRTSCLTHVSKHTFDEIDKLLKLNYEHE